MKKVVFLLLFIPFCMVGQEKAVPELSLEMGGGLKMNFLTRYGQVPQGELQLKPKLGGGAHVLVNYKFAPKFSVQTGVEWEYRSVEMIYSGLVFGADVNPLFGTSSTSTLEEKMRCQALFVPLVLEFYPFKNGLFFTGGLTVNYLFNGERTQHFFFGNGGESKTFAAYEAQWGFGALIGGGFSHHINENTSFKIATRFKHDIGSYIQPESAFGSWELRFSLRRAL